ncbi:MAG TPA: ATP-binding protein [Candidatus Dormibacteraeota bacterium]|nr:ATP-binding protein [Candidatus Dormibacteraeota bacterium]
MRLALKNTLLLLGLYLVAIGGVGWWMVQQLDELAHAMVVNAARLVGDQAASSLSESALQQLRSDDPAARLRLAQIVDQVTEHSSLLTSVAVVDRAGQVIAGDNIAVGRNLALPDLVFPGGPRARLVRAAGPFEQDTFYVLVPLLEGDQLAGYVRLGMRMERVSVLYRRATRNLLGAAGFGLLAIGAIGLLLHRQLLRRSQALATALEQAAEGGPAPVARRDEFSRAIEVARRVGRELNEARGGRVQVLQRLDALMKALDVGVLIVEPDGALSFANGHAAVLLGYADPAALTADWDANVRPLVQETLGHLCDQAAGQRITHELPARGDAGQLRLEFYAMGEGACPQVILVRSASSLDALQSELGLAIQMRGLTRFYAAFAHDLKAPLNAMVLTLELLKLSLQQAVADADGEKRLRYVATLNEEIARLDRQLRALLAHTAPPRDERGAVDLCALLDLLVQLLAPQAKRQGVQLDCALPAAPLVLVGHADRLKQALLNILINALEAMPDGGELAIRLEPVDRAARISVRDTGPGIPAELLERIYQMHFTSKSGGTGVGLYVARSVVESHGGVIDVHSAAGAGTLFTVTLPTDGVGELFPAPTG